MNFSIPAAGMEAASAVFETAANAIPQALSNATNNILSAGSTLGDSVDLSTAVAVMAKSSLDFQANVQVALVEKAMQQSTFSAVG
jgi:hypothetical protein